MKRLLLTTSIAALLLSSVTALAAPGKDGGHDDRRSHAHGNYRDDDRGDRRGDDRHDRRGDDRYDRDDDRQRHGDNRRGNDNHRNHNGRHDNGRHLGHYKQAYRRGQRAPAVYLQPRYYVHDYRTYRLSAPPRGYRWVRPENDRYLLVEAATGLISQVLGY